MNVLALTRMLGHKSAKITPDTYADLFDTDLDAAADVLDSKCAHSVPKPRPVGPAGNYVTLVVQYPGPEITEGVVQTGAATRPRSEKEKVDRVCCMDR
jgi:hypothetical protein